MRLRVHWLGSLVHRFRDLATPEIWISWSATHQRELCSGQDCFGDSYLSYCIFSHSLVVLYLVCTSYLQALAIKPPMRSIRLLCPPVDCARPREIPRLSGKTALVIQIGNTSKQQLDRAISSARSIARKLMACKLHLVVRQTSLYTICT